MASRVHSAGRRRRLVPVASWRPDGGMGRGLGSRLSAGDASLAGQVPVSVREHLEAVGTVFAEFDGHDSNCASYGVHVGRNRWFVKHALGVAAAAGLARAEAVAATIDHPAPTSLRGRLEAADGPALVYEWVDAENLYARPRGFYGLAYHERRALVDPVIELHVALAAAGFAAVDFYDGCLLHDRAAGTLRVCDLDEYRRGAFLVPGERLPGSLRFMAPEELGPGTTIDERTMVHTMGRMLLVLLGDGSGDEAAWTGPDETLQVARQSAAADREGRFASILQMLGAWTAANKGAKPG